MKDPSVAPLVVPEPLTIAAGASVLGTPPFTLARGAWLLLRPAREALGPDPASAIARVLTALDTPARGHVELFGTHAERLGYEGLLRVRRHLALVPSSGGLLANRTLRDNIALPLSVHEALPHHEEQALVTTVLGRFGLLPSERLFPHEVAGSIRLRACVARATTLAPALYVVEGTGEFVSVEQPGLCWKRLSEEKIAHRASLVACTVRPDADFERWFEQQGGSVMEYALHTESARAKESVGR